MKKNSGLDSPVDPGKILEDNKSFTVVHIFQQPAKYPSNTGCELGLPVHWHLQNWERFVKTQLDLFASQHLAICNSLWLSQKGCFILLYFSSFVSQESSYDL